MESLNKNDKATIAKIQKNIGSINPNVNTIGDGINLIKKLDDLCDVETANINDLYDSNFRKVSNNKVKRFIEDIPFDVKSVAEDDAMVFPFINTIRTNAKKVLSVKSEGDGFEFEDFKIYRNWAYGPTLWAFDVVDGPKRILLQKLSDTDKKSLKKAYDIIVKFGKTGVWNEKL